MTTYTTAELATRVLKDLGLIAAEETPSAADLSWAEETVSSEIMQMSARGIPIWNGSDVEVPQEYLTILSRRIGLAIAPSYGLTDAVKATVAIEAVERNLRVLGTIPATGTTQTADYY
jgi:hypothetical protein